MTAGKGTLAQLDLARRALKVAITHVGIARHAMRGDNDTNARDLVLDMYDAIAAVARLRFAAAGKRRAASGHRAGRAA